MYDDDAVGFAQLLLVDGGKLVFRHIGLEFAAAYYRIEAFRAEIVEVDVVSVLLKLRDNSFRDRRVEAL
ncbi:hypothetical protein SDC9_179973 [bioreactor metagenome]|uniref:Uncharacterized protein n=1 Tax=bioreactor metagenome TaxID=1076179 RepID=A0A645H892_9ZZZZ